MGTYINDDGSVTSNAATPMTAPTEREAVVAWLRRDDHDLREILRLSLLSRFDDARDVSIAATARRKLADAIERGDHIKDMP